MPLEVVIKIGKKPRGLYLPRFHFYLKYLEGEDLKLNPHFTFNKEYKLPDKIYLTQNESAKFGKNSQCCTTVDSIIINIDTYPYMNQPQQAPHIRQLLRNTGCHCACENCKAYLEWRAGNPPDYSDYIAVFQQIEEDLLKTWNNAIAEAYASGEMEELDLSTSSSHIPHCKKEVEEKISRKVKLS